tara:strand:- start:19 stop:1245 length:1227 start_codon:yes stop_codon:yes gene_type:complete
MSLKDQAIKVLIEEGKILLPNNRWVPYQQLEHEYYHHNNVDAAFIDSINLKLDKWISVIVDYGYGDITCNLNYWLWLNEIRPVKLKILVDETHYTKEFYNKESTIDKVDYFIKEQCQSNIEYMYTKIERPFGNLLRSYKSAFRGTGFMRHTTKTYRNMWHKYVPVNLEQYWFVPLSMQLEWFPVKSSWKKPKEKVASLYRYQPPKDWSLIDNYSFANIGDKMISQDEKEVNKYWKDLETALKKEGYKVEYLTYKMSPKQLFTKLSKSTIHISSRGGFAYLAQHVGTPTVTIFPPKEMVLGKNYHGQHVQFHNRSARLFDPSEIAKIDIDELAESSSIEKSLAFYRKMNYNTLEKMQRLEKDVQSFEQATAKAYNSSRGRIAVKEESVKATKTKKQTASKTKAKTKSKK